MHPIVEYFLYMAKKNVGLITAIIVVPVVLPFVLYGIMFAILTGPEDVGLTPV